MGHYKHLVIESFRNPGEQSTSPIRCRPFPGQGIDTQMRVECSKKMREQYPVGTCFLVQAQEIDKEGGATFLYTHYNWPFEVLTKKEAQSRINQRKVPS